MLGYTSPQLVPFGRVIGAVLEAYYPESCRPVSTLGILWKLVWFPGLWQHRKKGWILLKEKKQRLQIPTKKANNFHHQVLLQVRFGGDHARYQ